MNNSKCFWFFLFLILPWIMVNSITSMSFNKTFISLNSAQCSYLQFSCASSQDKKRPQSSLSAASYVSQLVQRSIPIRYKIQKPNFLFDCSNKKKCQAVALQCDAALVAAQKQGNQEQIKRLEKRLQALNSKNSKTIKSVLYQEFDGALASSAALVQRFSNNIQVYVAHGTAVIVAQKAEVEKDLGMVCSYADVVHDLVTIVKVTTGTVRGICRGIKQTMMVEHAKQLIQGTAHMVKAMAQRVGEFIELAPLLGDDFGSAEQTIVKFEHDNPVVQKVLREHFNAQCKLLKETPWEKIAEVGAELGTTLLLDVVIFHGAGLAASTVGRKFIAEVVSILEEGGVAQVTYCTDVAMIGKAVIEAKSDIALATTESEALGAVLKEVEKHQEVLVEGKTSIGSILKEEIETKSIWNYIKPTEDMYLCIKIPRSFEITVGDQKLWVHPNATKHMEDYMIRTKILPHMSNIDSQILLKSFHAAVKKAIENGIPKSKESFMIDGWELSFGKPRGNGIYPTIMHANYKPLKQ